MTDTTDMLNVESSNIHSIGFDAGSDTLHVRFGTWGRDEAGERVKKPGKLYRYFAVPPTVFADLVRANDVVLEAKAKSAPPEIGFTAYFNRTIKGEDPKAPNYKYEAVKE